LLEFCSGADAAPRARVSPVARLVYNRLRMTLAETLVAVWRQILVERAAAAEIDGVTYPAVRTSTNRLWQVDFKFEGHALRGIEQNPKTKSRWAQLARSGKRVMQFLDGSRYLAVVVDGKVTLYGKEKSSK
jgi:hypothetical protein